MLLLDLEKTSGWFMVVLYLAFGIFLLFYSISSIIDNEIVFAVSGRVRAVKFSGYQMYLAASLCFILGSTYSFEAIWHIYYKTLKNDYYSLKKIKSISRLTSFTKALASILLIILAITGII